MTTTGIKQSYSLILPIKYAGHHDVCRSSILWLNATTDEDSCVDYFSSNWNTTHLDKKREALMYNYCTYCLSGNVDLQSKLDSSSFFFELQDRANRKRPMCGPGKVILHYAKDRFTKKDTQMFACLCKPNSYTSLGFACDSFQRFWIPYAFLVDPWVTLPLFIILFNFIVVYIAVPTIVKTIRAVRFAENKLTKFNCIFGIRNQSIVWLMLSTVFISVEQISGTMYALINVRDYATMRYSSISTIPICYALTLIHWAHICSIATNESTDTERLSIPRRLAAFLVYLTVAFIMLTGALCFVFNKILIGYAILAAMIVICNLLLPIGFSLYGLKLYLMLRRSNACRSKPNFFRLKFTRFVMIANLLCILIVVIGAAVMLSYIIGWDYAGKFLGLNREILMDSMIFCYNALIAGMLTNFQLVKDAYGQRVSELMQFRLPQSTKEDDDDVYVKMEQQNK